MFGVKAGLLLFPGACGGQRAGWLEAQRYFFAVTNSDAQVLAQHSGPWAVQFPSATGSFVRSSSSSTPKDVTFWPVKPTTKAQT